jgi:hypothetical protein
VKNESVHDREFSISLSELCNKMAPHKITIAKKIIGNANGDMGCIILFIGKNYCILGILHLPFDSL